MRRSLCELFTSLPTQHWNSRVISLNGRERFGCYAWPAQSLSKKEAGLGYMFIRKTDLKKILLKSSHNELHMPSKFCKFVGKNQQVKTKRTFDEN